MNQNIQELGLNTRKDNMSFKISNRANVRVNHLYSTQNERKMSSELKQLRKEMKEINHREKKALSNGVKSPYASDRYGPGGAKLLGSPQETSWRKNAGANIKKLNIL